MNNADLIEKLGDDIARLTAERDELRDKVEDLEEGAHIGANTIQMYLDEVERLREALKKIADGWVIDKDQITTADVARAALEVNQ